MKFVKQRIHLTVKNCNELSADKKDSIVHSPLLPNSIRALIVGPSNCGKTNVMKKKKKKWIKI